MWGADVFGQPWFLPAMAVVVALLFVAAMLWLSLTPGPQEPGDQSPLPTITAPDSPVRVPPPPVAPAPEAGDSPESLLVGPAEPVETRTDPAPVASTSAETLPPPVSVPDAAVAQAQGTPPTPVTEGLGAPLSLTTSPEGGTSPAQAKKPETTVLPPPPPPRTRPAKQAFVTRPQDPVQAVLSSGAGPMFYYVQLGSVTDPQNAADAVLRFRDDYADVFGQGSSWRVVPVNLEGRGVFHRIQAGPYTEVRAREICAAIRARTPPGACVVMR